LRSLDFLSLGEIEGGPLHSRNIPGRRAGKTALPRGDGTWLRPEGMTADSPISFSGRWGGVPRTLGHERERQNEFVCARTRARDGFARKNVATIETFEDQKAWWSSGLIARGDRRVDTCGCPRKIFRPGNGSHVRNRKIRAAWRARAPSSAYAYWPALWHAPQISRPFAKSQIFFWIDGGHPRSCQKNFCHFHLADGFRMTPLYGLL